MRTPHTHSPYGFVWNERTEQDEMPAHNESWKAAAAAQSKRNLEHRKKNTTHKNSLYRRIERWNETTIWDARIVCVVKRCVSVFFLFCSFSYITHRIALHIFSGYATRDCETDKRCCTRLVHSNWIGFSISGQAWSWLLCMATDELSLLCEWKKE